MIELCHGMVSTIIPVFNRPDMLRAAVHSVLDQSYRPIEILIVDDGSTDDTPKVAHEFQVRYPSIVVFIRSEKNSGLGPGPMRELGRLRARGEFLQYLDSDDRLMPNKFSDQVAVFRKHSDCQIAYGITRLVNEDAKVLAEPYKWTGREMPGLFPGLLVDRWWCTHTPLYRRTLTDAIGPWCQMRWSQDWEYDARAGALGARIVSCGTLVSEHLQHTGVRQTSPADWGRDPDRLRNRFDLLAALWQHAQTAGVGPDAPERQHFARWCFRIGRQCGAAGLSLQAERLLRIATESAQNGPGSRGLGFYRKIAAVLGQSVVGRIATIFEATRQGAGRSTLPQSFSGQGTSQ